MKSGILAIFAAIAALVLYWSTFSLTPAQQALVLQFGEVKGVQTTPGLKFKLPWQNVLYFDKRILNLNMPPIEPILKDKKRLLVDLLCSLSDF